MNKTDKAVNDPNANHAMYERDRVAKREAQPTLPAVTGWRTCAGAQNQISGKPCAICGQMTHDREAVTGDSKASRVTKHKFELKRDGSVERVGPFGSYGPVIEAQTKTEANALFLRFAYRASENTPKVKIRNGAYQLAYESLSYGVSVESGVEGRDNMSLCFSGASDWSSINDSLASFDYYASAEYQNAK